MIAKSIALMLIQMISLVLGIVIEKKPQSLSILSLVTLTGNDPRDGRVCKAAIQVAVEAANQMPDFLPQFNVIPIFKDEGPNSFYSVKELAIFKSETESASNGTSFAAPVIVGPYFTTTCIRLAPMLHHLDMAAVGTGCTATMSSGDRSKFPNLYHMRGLSENIINSRVLFVQQIGGWDRVAILTSASNYRDYSGAVLMQNLLIQNGIAVPWFGSALDIDDLTVNSFKSSDLRILLIELNVVDMFVKFVCAVVRNNFAAGKYIFIAQTNTLFDLNGRLPNLPTGCTRAALIEQMKYFYFVGTIAYATQNNGPTSLGYDNAGFEKLLAEKIDTKRSGDVVVRHICHDTMLQALLALNNSQEELARKNLTLMDYNTHSHEVSKAVNASLAKSEFSGVRVGPQRYSPRIEFDDEPQAVYHFVEESQTFEISHLIQHNATGHYNDLTSYSIQKVREFVWWTTNKKSPKSYVTTMTKLSHLPLGYVISVDMIAGAFSLLQMVLATCCFLRNKYTEKLAKYLDLATSFGCILINLAAACFVQSNAKHDQTSCIFIVILVVAGLTLINGCIVLRILATGICGGYSGISLADGLRISKQLTQNSEKVYTKKSGTTHIDGIGLSSGSYNHCPSRSKHFTICFTGLLLIANLLVIIVWLAYDLPTANFVIESGKLVYSDVEDAYIEYKAYTCSSREIDTWLGSICIIQLVLFFQFVVITFRNRHKLRQEIKPFIAAEMNIIAVLIATALLVLIFPKATDSTFVCSLAAIFISNSSFGLTVGRTFLMMLKGNTN